MPSIKQMSLAKAEQDALIQEYCETMKAKVEDMEKTGKHVPWRKHFRVAMCMSIG